MGEREQRSIPWNASSGFNEHEAYGITLSEGQQLDPSSHFLENEIFDQQDEQYDNVEANDEEENELEQTNDENERYIDNERYESDESRVDEDNFSENNSEIIYDLDKVCSTGGTSTHLQPRDDLSRHDAREKRKSTISVDLRDGTVKHSIHEFKKRKWFYKSYDKDNEFEQSKHFKLCQKEIELTAEHVLIHQAAYHHALSIIRHPFKEAYEAKVQELINSSENYSEVSINFQKDKYSFLDPINESIWWQKKYMQEVENTKMFKNYEFSVYERKFHEYMAQFRRGRFRERNANNFKSSSSGGVPSSLGGGSGNPGMISMGTPVVNRFYSSLPNPLISTMTAAPVPNSTYKNLYQNQPNLIMPVLELTYYFTYRYTQKKVREQLEETTFKKHLIKKQNMKWL